MLGDDLDPSVMTAQVRSGGVSDAHTRGSEKNVEMVKWSNKGESKTQLVSKRSTNATERNEERQLRADASFKNTMPMQCA